MRSLNEAFRAGEPIRESAMQSLVEAATARVRLSAASPLVLTEDQGGLRLELAFQHRLEPFVLLEMLEAGEEAEAALLLWDGHKWLAEPQRRVVVGDPLVTFFGEPGTRGWATFHHQSGKWLIVQLACSPAPSSSQSGVGG